MVMVTAKLSKGKILAIILLLAAVAAVLVLCLNGSKAAPVQQSAADAEPKEIKSNEDRIGYLKERGWKVKEEPVQTQEVRVPDTENEVFSRYNTLQISQGFDLTQYAGKTIQRYVYEITNYPDSDECWYATLLVYKNSVIGGDVASGAKGGGMHGLSMP